MNAIMTFPCMVTFEEDVDLFSQNSTTPIGTLPAGTEIRIVNAVNETNTYTVLFEKSGITLDLPENFNMRELTEEEVRTIFQVDLLPHIEVRCNTNEGVILYGPQAYFKPIKKLSKGEKLTATNLYYGYAAVEKKGIKGYVDVKQLTEMSQLNSTEVLYDSQYEASEKEEPVEEEQPVVKAPEPKVEVPEEKPEVVESEEDVLFAFLCDTDRKQERFELFVKNDLFLKEKNVIFVFHKDVQTLANILTKFEDVPIRLNTYNYMLLSSADELVLKKYMLSKGFRFNIYHKK